MNFFFHRTSSSISAALRFVPLCPDFFPSIFIIHPDIYCTISICLQYQSIYFTSICPQSSFTFSIYLRSEPLYLQFSSVFAVYISTVHKNPCSIHISTVSFDLQFQLPTASISLRLHLSSLFLRNTFIHSKV